MDAYRSLMNLIYDVKLSVIITILRQLDTQECLQHVTVFRLPIGGLVSLLLYATMWKDALSVNSLKSTHNHHNLHWSLSMHSPHAFLAKLASTWWQICRSPKVLIRLWSQWTIGLVRGWFLPLVQKPALQQNIRHNYTSITSTQDLVCPINWSPIMEIWFRILEGTLRRASDKTCHDYCLASSDERRYWMC